MMHDSGNRERPDDSRDDRRASEDRDTFAGVRVSAALSPNSEAQTNPPCKRYGARGYRKSGDWDAD